LNIPKWAGDTMTDAVLSVHARVDAEGRLALNDALDEEVIVTITRITPEMLDAEDKEWEAYFERSMEKLDLIFERGQRAIDEGRVVDFDPDVDTHLL